MRTFTGRFVTAFLVTVGALVGLDFLAQSHTDWAIPILLVGGIPYIVFMLRWIIRG